jgi:secreted PhoX family phosphatase
VGIDPHVGGNLGDNTMTSDRQSEDSMSPGLRNGGTHAPSDQPKFVDVLNARISRRDVLRAGTVVSAAALGSASSLFSSPSVAATGSTLTFREAERVYDETHHVAPGYSTSTLLRWGDPILPGAPPFDPRNQSRQAQSKQFGYNCDFVAFLPLPLGSNNSEHGLLCVNNEYASPHIMFPDWIGKAWSKSPDLNKEQADTLMASVGHSVVEIRKIDGEWQTVADSRYNRRISLFTEMEMSGPAAGHRLVRTSEDPSGTKPVGTHTNCSGGVTPWGTVLTCEEWAYYDFGGDPAKTDQEESLKRYGASGRDGMGLARHHSRFNMEEEANELNRFQWTVEIDPYDPQSVPKKRSALGRFGREGSQTVISSDGRLVVYSGDDARFEYLYRFVSRDKVNLNDRAANENLLDHGVLSVARFDEDGTVTWLPLVHGEGPLSAENGFADQGEVLIKARFAADALGATTMDRPEDFEVNPVTGRVYVVMTKNKKRKAETLNVVNPRADNRQGHIVELIPPGKGPTVDHGAERFGWDMLVLCGDPGQPEQGSSFHPDTSANGWFATPDNIAFDPKGRLWIGTDGMNSIDTADGIYGMDLDGPARGLPKALFFAPFGAECTGPCFTPDGETLFVAVQHPGEDSENSDNLTTRWPDFNDDVPPRPSVLVITRDEGGEIGS